MLKIVKKDELSGKKALGMRLVAVLAALVASSIIILIMGQNPLIVYSDIVVGSTGTEHRLIQMLNKAIPLIVLSLGISVAFKMKFWNIGAEGQFYMGALGATFVALNFNILPIYILIPFMMIVGFVMGGLWCLLPAVLKSKFGTSETLVTLMLNYIASGIVSYLQYGPWKDPGAQGFPKIATFTDNAILPNIFGTKVHSGFIIALVLVVIIHIFLTKSKKGYEISVLGENETTARYAGMNIYKTLAIGAMISGGLCGIAGFIQASAIENSLTDTLSGGLGFTAIITAWLAKLSAPAIVVVSILFAILLQGGAYIQSTLQIPATISEILQGVILFFVLGSEFFINYKIIRDKGGNN